MADNSQNALKHGLCARTVVLSGESEADFIGLQARIKKHFAPVGEIENYLAVRIGSLMWRLARCERTEVAMFRFQRLLTKESEAQTEIKEQVRQVDPLDELEEKPYTTILDENKHDIGLKKAEKIRRLKGAPEIVIGKSFYSMQDGFVSLNRYETGFERSLYRAIYELERLQTIRKNSPPTQNAQNAQDAQVA